MSSYNSELIRLGEIYDAPTDASLTVLSCSILYCDVIICQCRLLS